MSEPAAPGTGDGAERDDEPELKAANAPLRFALGAAILLIVAWLALEVALPPDPPETVLSFTIQTTDDPQAPSEPWELWLDLPWYHEFEGTGRHPLLERAVDGADEVRFQERDGVNHLVISGQGAMNVSFTASSEDLDLIYWTDRNTLLHNLSVELVSPEPIGVLVFLNMEIDGPGWCEDGIARNRVAFDTYPVDSTTREAAWLLDTCLVE